MRPKQSHGARALAAALATVVALAGCGGGDDVQVVERAVESPVQAVVLSGLGAPDAAMGQDGQFYLDAQTLLLYGPRANGQWPTPPVPISGAPGAPGADGQDGAPGVDGSRMLSGIGAPSAALGNDGDYYLDTGASTLFGPKAAGGWPAVGLSLVGAAGPAGADGQDGATGPQGPASVDLHWSIASNSTFGNGSYYMWPQGPNPNARNPVLLPRACTLARLQVATFGQPTASASHLFTVQHTPGPDLSEAATASTALSCTINSAQRSCDTGTVALNVNAGDAIEVHLVGNEGVTAMATPGSWSIAFTCQ